MRSVDISGYCFTAVTVGQMDGVIRRQFHCFSVGQKFSEWPYRRSAINKAFYRYCSLSMISVFGESMELKMHILFPCLV